MRGKSTALWYCTHNSKKTLRVECSTLTNMVNKQKQKQFSSGSRWISIRTFSATFLGPCWPGLRLPPIFSSSFWQHRALPHQPRDDLSSVSWLCVRLKASWISWVVVEDLQDIDWLMCIMLSPSLQKNSVHLFAQRLFADVHTNSLKLTVRLCTVCHIWCETTLRWNSHTAPVSIQRHSNSYCWSHRRTPDISRS